MIIRFMKRYKKPARNLFFLLILLAAVFCGNFLYTKGESAAPLEGSESSPALSEGYVIRQSFTPEHPYLTNLAIGVKKSADMDGTLLFSLYGENSEDVLCSQSVPVSAVTDKWYLDFTINRRLDTNTAYEFRIEVTDSTNPPSLYLCPNEKGPEENFRTELAKNGSVTSLTSSVCTRYTYNVLVPARAAALAAVLLLCFGFFYLTDSVSFYELLKRPLWKGRFRLIHIAAFLAVTMGALALRLAFLPFQSMDYHLCYDPWISDIRGNGGIFSLGGNIGDYAPLYMTLLTLVTYLPFEPVVIIKLMPLVFDFILAGVMVLMASGMGLTSPYKRLALYACMVLNPITVLNSSAWGQCDGMYTVFLLLALFGLCFENRQKWYASGDGVGFFFAVAFSFKLQAIFFLPVLGLVLITQKKPRFKPVHFLWTPVIYTLSCIPMYLAGRDLKTMFKIYLGQADRNYGTLNLNYPNFFTFTGASATNLNDGYFYLGLLSAFFLLLLLYYLIYCRNISLDGLGLCKITVISILVICFFMPNVHERYAYPAEMLLLLLAVLQPKYAKAAIPTLLCTLCGYCTYLFSGEGLLVSIPVWVIACVRLGCLIWLIYDFYRENTQSRSC